VIDLRHLRHALALAEHRHYVRAADACHITQPALTRSIQSLETSLGVTLFDRGRGGVEPTALGRLLLQHAVGLETASRELEREVQLARGLEVGELVVGVGPYGGAALVGPVLARLNQRHPKLRIRVLVAPWTELPARARSREVDVVVAELSEIAEQDDFESRPLSVHRLFVVCRAGHPLATSPARTVQDVFRFPLAGPQLPAAAYERLCTLAPPPIRAAMRRQGALAIQCDSSAVLKAVVMGSDAVSMMSGFMLDVEWAGGQLVILPDLDLGLRARFGAAWMAGRTVSGATSRFIELLQVHDQAMQALAESQGLVNRPHNVAARPRGAGASAGATRRPRTTRQTDRPPALGKT
jgi:DNA-binding transcriptional LysR family regulator